MKQKGKEAITKREKRPNLKHGGFALLKRANMYMAPATSMMLQQNNGQYKKSYCFFVI